jgi:hypothetical protein
MNVPANPYTSPSFDSTIFSPPTTRFRVLGGLLLMCALIGGLASVANLVFWNLAFNGNALVPSPMTDDRDYVVMMLAVGSFMLLQSVVMLAGAISLFVQRYRWLAILGAWAGIVPMCGIYVLSLGVGIACLIVLHRQSAIEAFRRSA